jgi:hypothetical protein
VTVEPFKGKPGTPPELKLRTEFKALMEKRGWFVHITHGNAWSSGLPDLFCAHVNYGVRWIEVKHADSYHFTRDQKRVFPLMSAKGVGIWVVALPRNYSESLLDYEYRNVVVEGPPNWTKYLGHSKRPY